MQDFIDGNSQIKQINIQIHILSIMPTQNKTVNQQVARRKEHIQYEDLADQLVRGF